MHMRLKSAFIHSKESLALARGGSIFIVALAGMILFTLTTPVFAEWDQDAGAQNVIKTLNLSPEQKDRIMKQQNIDKEKKIELKDKMRTKRLELKQELERPETDKGKIDSIVADIKALTSEQLEFKVNSILAVKQILTPEQFKELQKAREGKRRERNAGVKEGRK